MSTTTKPRVRTEEEMRDALQRLIDGRDVMSIPPDQSRDADFILSDAIEEVLAYRRFRTGTLLLPQFRSADPCSKCGAHGAIDRPHQVRYVSALAAENREMEARGLFGVEHLEVRCWRCGYQWAACPLDDAPAEPSVTVKHNIDLTAGARTSQWESHPDSWKGK
jgi:hypothetical protein